MDQNNRTDRRRKVSSMLKTINIITTAALPWRTGTAVLPLMRAFHLAQKGFQVTLYVPWVVLEQQGLIFGANLTFRTQQEQERHIRTFLPVPNCYNLQISFYPGNFSSQAGSIFPRCALSKLITPCDWLILEEPEHLNWLHPFNQYKDYASRVTGIVITNYAFYVRNHAPAGRWLEKPLNAYNRWLVQRHCDDVIRVSDVLLDLPRSTCLYVNGAQPEFFEAKPPRTYSKSLYFMGKLIWPKGFKELVDLLSESGHPQIDLFGTGMDWEAIQDYAQKQGVKLDHQGLSSQPAVDLSDYKIFFNASRSEIICTTTVEAFVQQKFVLLPRDPSNDYFYQFKNCLAYGSREEFQEMLNFALQNDPQEDPLLKEFSWEAATERLLDYYIS